MHFNKLQSQPQRGKKLIKALQEITHLGKKGENGEIICNNDTMYCVHALLRAHIGWMEALSQTLRAVLSSPQEEDDKAPTY